MPHLEIEDELGNVSKLHAVSLAKGVCVECDQVIYAESNIGDMICPHCAGRVEWVWGKAQLSFVPDIEARFASIPPPKGGGQ